VAEGVEKVALTMNAPRCVVISHVIETALRARGQCTCHERVGVIAEHLDSHGRRAEDGGTFPPVRFWLADENGAPASSSPATEPRLHNTVAPRARSYQAIAAGASVTASMTEMTGGGPC